MKNNKIKNLFLGKYTFKSIIQKIEKKFIFRLDRMIYYNKSKQLQEHINHWTTYRFLKRKYKEVLNNTPIYQGSGEYSNKVWWCWLQGEDQAPELCQACLDSLRYHLKDKEIIVITEINMWDYIEFPDYVIKKYNQGIITRTHLSDLLRLELLIQHGGTWIDSSVFCTGEGKDVFENPLFVYQNFKRGDEAIEASSWLISAEKNNPILCATRDLLYEYWKKNDILVHYFLFHFFFKMATEKYHEEWKRMHTFSNLPPHTLQFEILDIVSQERIKQIERMSDFHKLTQKLELPLNIKGSYYEYIVNRQWRIAD
ncbi:capsular polysaccharide synthesis protein [Turicibacter sp. GALT-G1]|uniref:capsular polysaccharide synthesis protein n=1 Tax=Turicibacter sp. GALT-G1 TaxID=2951140 RepID=UPI0021D4D0F4|nr:capsular polysaccharide synthesis protein [Turicibacter sp. GALT-G1]MCU7207420.1 capsular polysaccharide synthesis protein [Turicibacter sp. GALT-G1]